MNETKPEIVSDAAEKKEAANILKAEQKQRHKVGENNRGVSIDEHPLTPIGSVIFLKWNVKKSSILLDDKNATTQLETPYFEVSGYGANVKSVQLGDKLYLKDNFEDQMGSGINEMQLIELNEKYKGVPDGKKKAWDETYKWHVIYESVIAGIYK